MRWHFFFDVCLWNSSHLYDGLGPNPRLIKFENTNFWLYLPLWLWTNSLTRLGTIILRNDDTGYNIKELSYFAFHSCFKSPMKEDPVLSQLRETHIWLGLRKSSTKQWLSTRGNYALQGTSDQVGRTLSRDIVSCHNWGVNWHLVGSTQGCCHTPLQHTGRTLLQQKTILPHISQCKKVEVFSGATFRLGWPRSLAWAPCLRGSALVFLWSSAPHGTRSLVQEDRPTQSPHLLLQTALWAPWAQKYLHRASSCTWPV